MMSDAIWSTPLILLPGVALLVLSTSMRFGQIHEEFHRGTKERPPGPHLLMTLHRRARLFRDALVSLYTAVGAFCLGAFLGAVARVFDMEAGHAVLGFACFGILLVVYAATCLIRESLLLLEVVEEHVEELRPSP